MTEYAPCWSGHGPASTAASGLPLLLPQPARTNASPSRPAANRLVMPDELQIRPKPSLPTNRPRSIALVGVWTVRGMGAGLLRGFPRVGPRLDRREIVAFDRARLVERHRRLLAGEAEYATD